MFGKRIYLSDTEFIEVRSTKTEGVISLTMGDEGNDVIEDQMFYCDIETAVSALRELAELAASGRLITPGE